jgi:predicted dehydrogenase
VDQLGVWYATGGFVPLEPITEGLVSDNGFINEIIHFTECCQEGKEPITSGRDNLGTMKIIFGIHESSRTGKAVDLADL